MKTIEMEGTFYRKLTSKKSRSLKKRVFNILFGIFLVLPGAFILLIPVLFDFAKPDSVIDWAGYLFGVVISGLFALVGIKTILANFRN